MAFHRGSQDLLLAIPFVAQVLVAGSCSYVVHAVFQHSHIPESGTLFLSLLARLRTYPHVGIHCCILEIKILFSHLSLQLSDFQLLL